MTRQQIHRRLDGASVRADQHHRVQVKLVDQPLLLLSLLDLLLDGGVFGGLRLKVQLQPRLEL